MTATSTLRSPMSQWSRAIRRRVLASFLLVTPMALSAQGTLGAARAVVGGETRTVQLAPGRALRLEIRLPRHYGKGAHRYPVLFVLDPEWNLDHAAATARFLAANTKMPEMLVVGVASGDRERDFTPTAGGGTATSGHAREFLDPSLWWEEGVIATDIAARLGGRRERGVLAIAEGQRQAESHRVADAATAQVQEPILSVSGESHLSMPQRGLYDAIRADELAMQRYPESAEARAALADGAVTGTEAPRHIPIPPGMTMPDIRITVRMTRAKGGA